MTKTIKYIACIPLLIILISCSLQGEQIFIVSEQENLQAGKELATYLAKTYSNISFQVSGKGNELKIQGRTPLAILNGTYGLLKEIGWTFYLSFEIPPKQTRSLNFDEIQISNAPLKDKRIIFTGITL